MTWLFVLGLLTGYVWAIIGYEIGWLKRLRDCDTESERQS